jgi:hypothetical protein
MKPRDKNEQHRTKLRKNCRILLKREEWVDGLIPKCVLFILNSYL